MDICNEQVIARKRLLLHSCCGPCSTAVVERLAEDYEITVFYFNPNITRMSEYLHRLEEQKRFLSEYSENTGIRIDFIEGDYEPGSYLRLVRGHEEDPEGGERCSICFLQRMEETARLAAEKGFDCFDTTLSVSPHKNYDIISGIGRALREKYGVEYISGNYKKRDGFKRSTQLSREYGLYRQDYCGCVYSERKE